MARLWMQRGFLLWASLLSGCSLSPTPHATAPETTEVAIRDGQLWYRGPLSLDANTQLFQLYQQAAVKPTRLVISSSGGEIGLGMALGAWLHQQQLDVEIGRLCASSCANYVFPAGRVKYIRQHSLLLWHGSAWQQDWQYDPQAAPEIEAYLTEMRQQETAFFRQLQVDNLLTVYGQIQPSSWRDWARQLIGQPFEGFDYSIADLERLGVRHIVLLDGQWLGADERWLSPVKRIHLPADYQFQLARFQ